MRHRPDPPAPQHPHATALSVPSTTIQVSNVPRATTRLDEVNGYAALESWIDPDPVSREVQAILEGIRRHHSRPEPAPEVQRTLEACSTSATPFVAGVVEHPFVAALHRAFRDHRPFVLSPDMLWLLIAQGFASHVRLHAEELRPQLVAHEGRVKIEVRRDDFVKGDARNPWPEVFGEFNDEVRKHLGRDTHHLLVPAFSTTGPVEKAVTEIVLLSALSPFFSYSLLTRCGIPEIVVEGTEDDWASLIDRTRDLGRFGLRWWTDKLVEILEQIRATTCGNGDPQFWSSIYKMNERSGGPFIDGWVLALFPYLKGRRSRGLRRNKWLGPDGVSLRDLLDPPRDASWRSRWDATTMNDFPSAMSRVPFVWKYYDERFRMEFFGGFVGVRQDSATLRQTGDRVGRSRAGSV